MSDPIKQFQTEVDLAFSAAIKSAKGGDEKWNSLLSSYSIMPLTPQQKEALLNSEMKIAGGAFPIELRWVLQAIVTKHANLAADNQDVQKLFFGYNMDAEVMKYYGRIKPFGGMPDIFKN